MLNPDNATLEWCAKWIEDSLRAETNERTIEFGRNMAMTIRAVKTATDSAPAIAFARDAAEEIREWIGISGLVDGQGVNEVAAIIEKHFARAAAVPVAGDRCTCNHRCPSKYERETEEAECVHADWCELMVAPALVGEAQRRMDQVVEAAVEWHQAGREGGEWLDTADRLANAIDSLLELRSGPVTQPLDD